jgi:hypothetical protein
MRNYKELMEDAYGEEGNTSSLSPRNNFTPPDAKEFFAQMEAMFGTPIHFLFTSDIQYRYQDAEGFGWLAWGVLYIAVPECDIYERHEDKWACPETLIEAVQECQHAAWNQAEEARKLKEDINQFLSKL